MRATVAPCRQIVMIISSDRSKFHDSCGVSQRYAQSRYRPFVQQSKYFPTLGSRPPSHHGTSVRDGVAK